MDSKCFSDLQNAATNGHILGHLCVSKQVSLFEILVLDLMFQFKILIIIHSLTLLPILVKFLRVSSRREDSLQS